MVKKKMIIGGLCALILLVLIGVFIMFMPKEKEYKDWESYVKDYEDKKISIKNDNNSYTNEFELKDKVLSSKDEKNIMDNIIEIYSIEYKGDNYTYIVSKDGKIYYLNNIKGSTQQKYELTELGDYKNIINIEVKGKNIIGTDINKKEYKLNEKMDTYIGYSM